MISISKVTMDCVHEKEWNVCMILCALSSTFTRYVTSLFGASFGTVDLTVVVFQFHCIEHGGWTGQVETGCWK